MKKSLFAKSLGGYLLIIILLSVLILFFSFRTIREYYIESLTGDLTHLCFTLETRITSLVAEKRFPELDAFVKDLGKHIKTRITVIDPSGVVVADSEKNPRDMEKHNLRAEIIHALQGEVGQAVRFSSTVQQEMLYVALPIKQKGLTLGVLRVSLFMKDITALLEKLQLNILYSVLAISILALFIALFYSYNLTSPIRELIAASRRVAAGDFSARVFMKRADELKELGDSFNAMTETLSSFFAEISSQKEELNNIISSIQEGLLVLDRKGAIVLSNASIRKALQSSAVDGKFYWEVIREPQFSALIDRVARDKTGCVDELIIQGNAFLCSATPLSSQEKTVVMCHDVTELKRVEKIKKDFVVNVSHELRTPLTAIKGFVETIEDDIDDKNRGYLTIIRRNTDRLINIVADLLLLSELEEKGVALSLEACDLKIMLEQMQKIFEPRLRGKRLSLTIQADPALPIVMADAFKLEQVFVNLLDNAIKYTETGGITISLLQRSGHVLIEIQDTGIGIPREHLSRIFERFYVVDASRSKQLGGTGLGLSIVKHIILLHSGTIEVTSTAGQGTKFIITLPINLSL
ncbi:MAG: ATP-binding protein [Proteobacteria bacterium]|nr:ATP-binding protein [Pseudomonadota bacterium]